MASPKPVPSPGALVEKNGSNMREIWVGSMPVPVSQISIATPCLLGAGAHLQAAALGHGLEGVADDVEVYVLEHVAVYAHGWHRLKVPLNRDAEVLGVFGLQVEQLL